MGSQPHLASRWEVVAIYKFPKFLGPTPKFGAQKKTKCLTTFFATSALDTAYLRNETSHQQTKMLVSIYNVPPTRLLLTVTFDAETAEIRLLIVTHAPFGGHYVAKPS